MKRLFSLILFGAVIGLGWYAVEQSKLGGWSDFSIAQFLPGAKRPKAAARSNHTIRIASFNAQAFGEAKLNDAEAMETLAAIVRSFDLVAIQEVRSVAHDIMPQLIDLLNADGRQFDYAIGPKLGRTADKEQYAFVFDTDTIEIDRHQLYTVDDPDDLLHREPLVGWFRARGPAPEEAFTFSLATVHTDPDETNTELDVLDDVFFKIRDDRRRGEDDVILAGDFNAKAVHLRQLGQVKGLAKIIHGETPTNTRYTAQYDNILFDAKATSEFTGRGGVFDFVREYRLTPEQAQRISDHLPVWAEFSIYEGGGLPVAARTDMPLFEAR